MNDFQTSRDILWKGIIEDLFEDFLHFFYPDNIELFDLSKGFEFLDKEFTELFGHSESSTRYVDKLIKVYTRDGDEEWILIHVEVQGYYDKDFGARMFNYYYRILEKYQKHIGALAIFTDNHPNFHPRAYARSFLETKMNYEFKTYKLLDKTPLDFEDKTNPFAIIMETAWYGLKKNKLNDDDLYDFKIRLIRRLLEFNYSKQRIQRIFDFIDYYVNFEKFEIKRKFEQEANLILKNPKPMGIREAIVQDITRQIEEKFTEEITEKVTEEVTEKVTVEITEKVTVEVTEKVTEEVTEKVTEEVTEKVTEEVKKNIILKLRAKGMNDEEISDILSLSVEEIIRLTTKA